MSEGRAAREGPGCANVNMIRRTASLEHHNSLFVHRSPLRPECALWSAWICPRSSPVSAPAHRLCGVDDALYLLNLSPSSVSMLLDRCATWLRSTELVPALFGFMPPAFVDDGKAMVSVASKSRAARRRLSLSFLAQPHKHSSFALP